MRMDDRVTTSSVTQPKVSSAGLRPLLSATGGGGQLVHGRPIRSRHQMPVHIYRHLDRTVPELVFHVGQRFPVLDQQRRERMSKVVKTDSA